MALTTVQNQMTAMGNSGASYEFVNRIINGAMVIDQRNAGASVTPTNAQYLVDRFSALLTQASKFTVQQNAGSVTPPTGFTNYLGVTSSSSYSVTSSDAFGVLQKIEGYNVSDFGWGAAGASSATLSFWVRSSLTGTFGGSLLNSDVTRSYPFSYTISSANTWTYVTITIPGDTTGTWLKTNGLGIQVHFGLGVGATYSGTAGAWAGAYYLSSTGAQSVVGTNGATWYVTGVQLEKGTTASAFNFRDYGRELVMCQRYYQSLTTSQVVGGSTDGGVLGSWTALQQTMRATPTITGSSASNIAGVGVQNMSYGSNSVSSAYFSTSSYSPGGGVARIFSGFRITASAEL